MSPTAEARTARMLRDRRGLPTPTGGWRRLGWIAATGDTQVAELAFGCFAVARGLFVLVWPGLAFGVIMTPIMAGMMPIRLWALTGLLPGMAQVVALAHGGVRWRRWSAYSNVGILWVLAVLWLLSSPLTLGAVVYGYLGVVQLYLALRLGAEPDRFRP